MRQIAFDAIASQQTLPGRLTRLKSGPSSTGTPSAIDRRRTWPKPEQERRERACLCRSGRQRSSDPPEAASDPESQDSAVTFSAWRLRRQPLEQRPGLFNRQPVSNSTPNRFAPLTRRMPAGRSGPSSPAIGSLVRKTPNGGEPNIDCRRSKIVLLQKKAVTENDGAVEREPRFGTVPADEVHRSHVRTIPGNWQQL
ncbi:MAG TPA: hypothetical protein VHB45_06140, partial [Alloacidobacterium sp.]|nr:hypothetical protein [Alloacidobacterium sp.]